MLKLVDFIVGLCQQMTNGAKYIILDSAFYNERDNLVCNILVTTTGREIEYSFDHILEDSKIHQKNAG